MNFMEHYIVGSTPWDEPCAQVGSPDYPERSRRECEAYIDQLLRVHGAPPGTASYAVKTESHDFGQYRHVVVYFDPGDPAQVEYADTVQEGLPCWDADAKLALGIGESDEDPA